MEEGRRSGSDRRDKNDISIEDKRNPNERRSLIDQQYTYISLLEKIPVFKDLRIDQVKRILRICKQQKFPANTIICRADDESLHMYILIKGMLKVTLPDGRELSEISPVEIVGEMGIFTGEKRSATVMTVEDSVVLTIFSVELLNLFRCESELGIQILMNIIQDLSHKLRKSNAIIEELKQVTSPQEYTLFMEKMLKEFEETD